MTLAFNIKNNVIEILGLVDKITLAVGFCIYENSLDTVKRAIESWKDHVDVIYAVDGKFEEFNSDQLLSTADVRAYLKSIPNVELVDFPNRLEHEKRQVYLDLCSRDMIDWLLIMDADEFITDETNWEVAKARMLQLTNESRLPQIFGMPYINPAKQGKRELGYPKIWRAPYLIKYMETHNFFQYTTDGKVYKSSTDWERIPGIFARANDNLRSKEYLEESYKYQLKLMKRESPYKMKYREIAENTKQWNQKDTRLPDGVPLM